MNRACAIANVAGDKDATVFASYRQNYTSSKGTRECPTTGPPGRVTPTPDSRKSRFFSHLRMTSGGINFDGACVTKAPASARTKKENSTAEFLQK